MATILIVDDNATNRGLLITLLGYKGRSSVKSEVFDLETLVQGLTGEGAAAPAAEYFVLDLGLPAGDGFTAMQRLKTNYELMFIPVIVVSARDPLMNEQRALESGAEIFFQKPFDNDELFLAIHKVLLKNGRPGQEIGR